MKVTYTGIFSAYLDGSLRGRGWKHGSGFVDGVFPVLGPVAQQILEFLLQEKDPEKVWLSLDTLSPTHDIWDDLINVAVQLRINKQWDPIVLVSKPIYIVFCSLSTQNCARNHCQQ